MNGYR